MRIKEHVFDVIKQKASVTGIAVLSALIVTCPVFASGTPALNADQIIGNKFDVFYSIVAAIVSAIGSIITLWGICEWGIAFQGQDGTSQAHAFKRIAGGMVMLLAPQLMLLF